MPTGVVKELYTLENQYPDRLKELRDETVDKVANAITTHIRGKETELHQVAELPQLDPGAIVELLESSFVHATDGLKYMEERTGTTQYLSYPTSGGIYTAIAPSHTFSERSRELLRQVTQDVIDANTGIREKAIKAITRKYPLADIPSNQSDLRFKQLCTLITLLQLDYTQAGSFKRFLEQAYKDSPPLKELAQTIGNIIEIVRHNENPKISQFVDSILIINARLNNRWTISLDRTEWLYKLRMAYETDQWKGILRHNEFVPSHLQLSQTLERVLVDYYQFTQREDPPQIS